MNDILPLVVGIVLWLATIIIFFIKRDSIGDDRVYRDLAFILLALPIVYGVVWFFMSPDSPSSSPWAYEVSFVDDRTGYEMDCFRHVDTFQGICERVKL